MKLYEFEGKQLFRNMGIATPKGDVAVDINEAARIAAHIGYPVVLKSQILKGGRGKAGGIQFAETDAGLKEKVATLLGADISVETVEKLLIEEKIDGAKEYYAGITLDPRRSLPMLMVSAKGGIDVEDVAQRMPEHLHTLPLDPTRTVELYHLLPVVSKTGATGKALVQISKTLQKLISGFYRYEAVTVEINPLMIGPDAGVVAADSKVEIDDSAIFRLSEINALKQSRKVKNPLAARARDAGLSYITMDQGNIGVISSGAGLAMSTMDMVSRHGGRAANFLDLGGGASPEKVATALKIVLETPGVTGVLFNVFGGANNCEQMANGIVRVIDELNPPQTIVVKMRGYSQEEGWKLLEDKNVPTIKFGTTEEAVQIILTEMQKKDI
jgi:succinyl-CoA synthetase beta subunit